MEDNKQQEFISWLADKLQAQDQNDLKKKIQGLGDDGVRKAYDQFVSEKSDVQSNRDGGKLQYIRCLRAFAKGGAMEAAKCGCGGKMQEGGSMKIKKDQGSRKDSDAGDSGRRSSIASKRVVQEVDDKPEAKKDGGKMSAKERLAMNLMIKDKKKAEKHQAGGMFSFDPTKSVQVEKDNGSITPMWGNNIQSTQKQYQLSHSAAGPQTINQQQLDSLQKLQGFNKYVGNSVAQAPGQVARFGPDQSDMIRKLLSQYAQPKQPMPNQQLTNNSMASQGSLTARLKYGGRVEPNETDSGDAPFGGGGIKTKGAKKNPPMIKSGSRKDVTMKEKDPGAKDYMTKGAKKEHTAVTKVPKGQGGGQLAGTMGGMMAGSGVRKPSLSKKSKKPSIMQKGGDLKPDNMQTQSGFQGVGGDSIGQKGLVKKKAKW